MGLNMKNLDADYLTPEDLMERYGGRFSLGTLANWRSRGEGPPFIRKGKRGGRILYRRADVLAWEATLRVVMAREMMKEGI